MNQAIREQNSEQELESVALERVSGWLEKADVLPAWPLQNREVIEAVRAVQYEADVDTIGEFIDNQYISPPAKRAGKFVWSATDLMHFAFALEHRERWQKFSPIHDAKKSSARRGRELAESQGLDGPVITDLEKFSAEDLLLYITRADDRRIREQLRECLLMKLGLV